MKLPVGVTRTQAMPQSVGLAAVGHEDDLAAVTQAAIGRCSEGVLEAVQFVIGEVDTDYGWLRA
jgi:hypothetical protein